MHTKRWILANCAGLRHVSFVGFSNTEAWLKRTIFAAAQDKIDRLKIARPDLKEVVNKFEKEIAWNKVKNESGLDADLKDRMLPALEAKMVEHKIHGTAFKEWIDYLHSAYENVPGFIYMMERSLLKNFDKQELGPGTKNAEFIAGVYTKMKEGNKIVDYYEEYMLKAKVQASKEMGVSEHTDLNGWVKIAGEQEDPENFDNNVSRLTAFSYGKGWCVANKDFATQYLESGNFYLYFVGGEAEVAIRTVGEETLAEIQGVLSDNIADSLGRVLASHWHEIYTFLKESGLGKKNLKVFAMYQEAEEKNTAIASGGPNVITNIANDIKKDLNSFLCLTKQNQLIPELYQAGKEKTIECIQKSEKNFAKIPFPRSAIAAVFDKDADIVAAKNERYIKEIKHGGRGDPEFWLEIEKLVKNDKVFYEQVKAVFLEGIENNRIQPQNVPRFFNQDADIGALKKRIYIQKIAAGIDPRNDEAENIFSWIDVEELARQDNAFYEKVKTEIIATMEKLVRYPETLPGFFSQDEDIAAGMQSNYLRRIENNWYVTDEMWKHVEKISQTDMPFYGKVVEAVISGIRRETRPDGFNKSLIDVESIPKFLIKDKRIIEAIAREGYFLHRNCELPIENMYADKEIRPYLLADILDIVEKGDRSARSSGLLNRDIYGQDKHRKNVENQNKTIKDIIQKEILEDGDFYEKLIVSIVRRIHKWPGSDIVDKLLPENNEIKKDVLLKMVELGIPSGFYWNYINTLSQKDSSFYSEVKDAAIRSIKDNTINWNAFNCPSLFREKDFLKTMLSSEKISLSYAADSILNTAKLTIQQMCEDEELRPLIASRILTSIRLGEFDGIRITFDCLRRNKIGDDLKAEIKKEIIRKVIETKSGKILLICPEWLATDRDVIKAAIASSNDTFTIEKMLLDGISFREEYEDESYRPIIEKQILSIVSKQKILGFDYARYIYTTLTQIERDTISNKSFFDRILAEVSKMSPCPFDNALLARGCPDFYLVDNRIGKRVLNACALFVAGLIRSYEKPWFEEIFPEGLKRFPELQDYVIERIEYYVKNTGSDKSPDQIRTDTLKHIPDYLRQKLESRTPNNEGRPDVSGEPIIGNEDKTMVSAWLRRNLRKF